MPAKALDVGLTLVVAPLGIVALVGALAVRFGLALWFSVFGDASAVYGTIGALLAVALSVYLVAIAIVFAAHVSAQVARLPDAAAMDRALEQVQAATLVKWRCSSLA